MPVYNVRQSFNNGAKSSSMNIDTDLATVSMLIGMMPDGVTSFSPDGAGSTGSARAVPLQYVEALAICKDTDNDTAKPSFVGIRFGRATLSDDDIVEALNGTIRLTSGLACNSVRIRKYNLIGAITPTASTATII